MVLLTGPLYKMWNAMKKISTAIVRDLTRVNYEQRGFRSNILSLKQKTALSI